MYSRTTNKIDITIENIKNLRYSFKTISNRYDIITIDWLVFINTFVYSFSFKEYFYILLH